MIECSVCSVKYNSNVVNGKWHCNACATDSACRVLRLDGESRWDGLAARRYLNQGDRWDPFSACDGCGQRLIEQSQLKDRDQVAEQAASSATGMTTSGMSEIWR